MGIIPPIHPKMFFRKVTPADTKEIRLNADMIRLLMVIDENKDLHQISKETGMDTSMLNQILSKLIKLKLIETVERSNRFLGKKFLEDLRLNLSAAVGPMAQILIEDTIAAMELKISEIPDHMAAELISNIAREVPEENNQIKFKKNMIDIMKKNSL
jgi:DNA-binding MarR family transcriptional regulator